MTETTHSHKDREKQDKKAVGRIQAGQQQTEHLTHGWQLTTVVIIQ